MDPKLLAVFSQLRVLLIAVGSVMAHEGWEHTTAYSVIMISSGAVMVVGPAAWGFWSAFDSWRKASAVGVQAGINMTVQGKALAEDGKTVVLENDGATPPKAVTMATAAEIVKDFAPTLPIARS